MRLKHERLLRYFLRLVGVVTCSAIFAVFMPEDWMAAAHERLGLGEMPRAPIVGYLARSTSALYAAFGALIIFLSFNLRTLLPVVQFVGCTSIALGILLTWIDFHVGLPPHWAYFEGPFDVILGLTVLFLSRTERA